MNSEWFGPSYKAWTRLWFGGGRTWFFFGCWPLVFVVVFWLIFKVVIWFAGVVLMTVIAAVMDICGGLSRWRNRRKQPST